MTTAIIVCGETSLDTIKETQHVAVLSPFRRRDLLHAGIHCISLFDIALSDSDNHSLCQKLDDNLQQEHKENPVLKWAPLAFCNVYFRFIYYYQFKQRLTLWLASIQVKKLILSSGEDAELLLAARSVCEQNAIELDILLGPLDDFSCTRSSHFYLTHDLPLSEDLDSSWFSSLIQHIWRLFALEKVLVQPYGNLPLNNLPVIPFKWIYVTGIRSILGRRWNKLKDLFFHKPMTTQISIWQDFVYSSEKDPLLLNASIWKNFDYYDRIVINSTLSLFYKTYSIKHLDALLNRAIKFIQIARIRKIILMHDYVPSSRFLCIAGHKAGIVVENLPHGVIWEACSPQTGSDFSPDIMLAWNDHSKNQFSQYGSASISVSHPRNQIDNQPLKRIQKNIHEFKVLVLLGSRIIPSLAQRMDCFESDFLEIWQGLKKTGIEHITVKYHNSSSAITARMAHSVKMLETDCRQTLVILDPAIDARTIMHDYDFVIVCACTTGILEVMQSGIPLIIFRGYIDQCGILNSFNLPDVYTAKDLSNLLKNYPYTLYQTQFKACRDSLQKRTPWFVRDR
ncbi:MAG: hypothetical protein HQM12_13270 [SAR324 cluster bacterium]|nr:hypothetical protein [SAR324 cluster bacterium]